MSQPMGKLHCPHCKSHNISPINETTINGAISTSRGRHTSTHVSNTHRNYWMCADCGGKFRNIQNLEEEIKKNKNNPTICAIISALAFLFSVYMIINLIDNPIGIIFLGFATFAAILTTVVFFCFIFVYKNRLKKMREELAFLKENCFN